MLLKSVCFVEAKPIIERVVYDRNPCIVLYSYIIFLREIFIRCLYYVLIATFSTTPLLQNLRELRNALLHDLAVAHWERRCCFTICNYLWIVVSNLARVLNHAR